MKLSPFEAPLFISSKPYLFEHKGAQIAQFSFPPPSMQIFSRQPIQFLSKDSEVQSCQCDCSLPRERKGCFQSASRKQTSICLPWSVFSPKAELRLLGRLGESRAPADVQSTDTFPKLLVCSQEPPTKVLSCLVASNTKIFRKEYDWEGEKNSFPTGALQLDKNTIF